MKVISIVLVLVLCSTVYGDYVAYQLYSNKECTGSPLFYMYSGKKIGTCYKQGTGSTKVKADLKTYTYSSTDCSGSGNAGDESGKCEASGNEAYKYAKMTKSELDAAVEGGATETMYSGSDACGGSEDKKSYSLYTSAYVNNCIEKQGGKEIGSSKTVVSGGKFITKTYTSTDCSGTASEKAEDMNKCKNTTTVKGKGPVEKSSSKITANPVNAPSAASMVVNSVTAILFALIVGMNLSQ
jgi:hypothetical protein